MNSDSGFGVGGAPYEYAVAEARGRTLFWKKCTFIMLYVLWGAILLCLGFLTGLLVPMLALIALTIWGLVSLTWRFLQVEYEYSFFQGTLTVAKILGGRTRRKIAEVAIRDLAAVFPYVDENVARAEAFGADRTIVAASSADAGGLYIALWQDSETEKRTMLCFEPNEKALKILRYYNISAMAK